MAGELAAVRIGGRGEERTQFFGSEICGTGDATVKNLYRLWRGVFAERIEFGVQKSKRYKEFILLNG